MAHAYLFVFVPVEVALPTLAEVFEPERTSLADERLLHFCTVSGCGSSEHACDSLKYRQHSAHAAYAIHHAVAH